MALKFLNNGYFAGKVGIGTESPNSNLDIIQTTDGSAVRIYGYDDRSAEYLRISDNGSSGVYGATGNVKLESGGSGYVFLDSNNDVFFDVGSSGFNFRFRDGAGNELVRIKGNGNVGIGTTSPSAKLHLAGAGAPDIRIQDTDGTNQYGDRGHNNGQTTYVSRNNNAFGSHVFYSADGTTTQTRVIFSQDFGTGSSIVTATGAAGSSYGGFLAVSSVATAQMWASDSGIIYIGSRSNHNINFTINNQVKAIINTSGNVGIGTTTPNTKLHVSTASSNSQLTLERTGSATGKYGIYTNTNNLYVNNVA